MKGPAPHEDRGFDPEPSVRRAARALHEETRRLPIISPHGHVDPRLLAENEPFPDPASLIVTPDHYILRRHPKTARLTPLHLVVKVLTDLRGIDTVCGESR